jgi:negative regulator of replication initiation
MIETETRDTDPVPVTKIRTVRVDDELWEAAQEKAKRRRESVADVLRRALLAYIEEDK